MKFSTTSIARSCSRHAWRTLAVWGVVLVGSIAALAFVLTGFTTESAGTNNPESERADDRLVAAFPPNPALTVTDLVVVRSDSLTVDDEGFRAFTAGLVVAGREIDGVGSAVTYFDTHDRSLVSADRHATLIPVNITDDAAAGDVIDAVERANADPEF